MNKNDEITVITVAYFSKHLIEDLINNLILKIKNLKEIIIVNNCNEDLSFYKSKIVTILSTNDNIGYGAAINYGFAFVKTTYILIVNPDVKIESFNLFENEKYHELFLMGGIFNNQFVSYCFPKIYDELYEKSIKKIKDIKLLNYFGRKKKNILRNNQNVDWISGSLIFTNSKTIKELDGFDERFFLYYEEIDLCKRASLLNINVFINTSIAYQHNDLYKSSSKNVNEIRIRSEIESFIKYHKSYSNKFALKIVLILLRSFYLIFDYIFDILFKISDLEILKNKGYLIKLYRKYLIEN